MIGIASSPTLVVLTVTLAAIIGALVVVAVAYIRREPARLIAKAELERARAGHPSRLQVRLNIDLKERETISSGSRSAIRSASVASTDIQMPSFPERARGG